MVTWIAAVALVASYLAAAWLDVPTLQWLCAEDHPVETLSAVFFGSAAVVFAFCARRAARPRNGPGNPQLPPSDVFPCVVLAAGMLWIALEEISYGQRIFGFSTPALVSTLNSQREFNLHNLRFWSREDGLWHWFNLQRWFSLFWLVYCTAYPLLRRVAPGWRLWTRLQSLYVPLAPLALGLLFVMNYALAKLVLLLRAPDLTAAVTELKETNYGMLFAAFALTEWARLTDESGTIPRSSRHSQEPGA